MHFYELSPEQVLRQIKSRLEGLTGREANERLRTYGRNSVKVNSVPLWKKIIEPFMDIFVLVLVVAAIISVWHGDTLDAIIILTIIAVSAIIFYVQRFSTDRVLRNLSKHTIQKVTVTRSGDAITIDSSLLVPGDIVSLTEGDRIPADMRILMSANLRVDESQLTGESLPISKQPEALEGAKELYEQDNMLFQGSFIVSGSTTGVVVTTGNNTEFGNLASLSTNKEPESPIQKKINTLITKIIVVVAAASVVAFGLALLRGMDLLESIRFVMALTVSAVPESLPIAISVVLVLGMRRMAKKKALVRQMRAIETIGVITTIATDKTGTLTKNKLTVQEIWSPRKDTDRVLDILAHSVNHTKTKSFDPLDIAFSEHARRTKHITKGSPVSELPFEQTTAMSATLWHYGTTYRLYIKGSPEQIIKHSKLEKTAAKEAQEALGELAAKGYRVIGLASFEATSPITDLSALSSQKLDFVGFVAVADILRPEAKRAIITAQHAGVTVRMITGDHFETAYQIGKQLGMVTDRSEVFDCRAMPQLSDAELETIVEKTKVFSRVIPEQKYRLLTILKRHNITAMTGDGVNDVPALTNAHIGIAMGSGSHIAKDAGDIILLDDNFKTIIDAMKEGRTIIANIRRMLFYLLSTNAGELLTILGALILGIKAPLAPVQILWINLVTDTSMVIPLGLEPPEKHIIKQPPQKMDAPILSKTMIFRMILVALTMTALALIVYVTFKPFGHAYAQTLVFLTLVVSQWANAFNARSDNDPLFARLRVMNRSFYVGICISITAQLIALLSPLGEALHLVSVNPEHMLVVSVLGFIIPLIVCEFHKLYCRKKISSSKLA